MNYAKQMNKIKDPVINYLSFKNQKDNNVSINEKIWLNVTELF